MALLIEQLAAQAAAKSALRARHILHPRCEVTINAIVSGEATDPFDFVPQRVTLVGASHNKAGEATVEFMGSALPFMPQTIESAAISLYMGLADTPTGSIRTRKNLRFIGLLDDDDDDRGEGHISLKARDLSSILHDHKPLIPVRMDDGRTVDPTPRYSDTLRQAIQRILSVVPGWRDATAKPPLELRETSLLNLNLGELVEGRAKKGPITIKRDWSAWQAIEHLVGMCSLLVNVDLDEIVVRHPHGAFGGDGDVAYEFQYGGEDCSLKMLRFHKKFTRNRKGIKVVAWNPETRKRVEGVYPNDNDMRKSFAKRRPPPPKAKATKTRKQTQKPLPDPDRDVVYLDQGVFSRQYLDNMAERIWLERAHQEVDGQIGTPLWDEQILSLRNGDRIRVRLRPDIEDEVRRIGDDVLASRLLQEKYGCTSEAADLLIAELHRPFQDVYRVESPTFSWPSDTLATIKFINLIKVVEGE
jgi:hypothetical protein